MVEKQEQFREQVKILAQVCGEWNQALEQGVEFLLLHEDWEQLNFITSLLERKAFAQGAEIHPLMPEPADKETGYGEVILGARLFSSQLVRSPLESFSYGLLTSGPTGSGKSYLLGMIVGQLISQGIKCHVWDTQSEYSGLARLFSSQILDVCDFRDLRLNPFDPPLRVNQKEWCLGALCNYLRETLYWRDRTIELFRTVLLKIFQNKVEGVTPSIFLDEYSKIPKSEKRWPEFGSLERFATMLKSVECFQCESGEKIEDAAKKSRIVDIREAPNDLRKFLILDFTTKLILSREFKDEYPLDLVIVLDETAQFFSRESLSNFTDITESFYLQMLRTARKYGIGIILSEQVYSNIHPVARANCLTKIIFETRDSSSRKEIARDLGLRKKAEEYLSEISYQRERSAVVQLKNCPYPFLMKVLPYQKSASLSKKELQERREVFRSNLKWISFPKTASREDKTQPYLEEKHLKILKVVACNPLWIQQEYAKFMSMTVSTFSQYSSMLVESGLLNKVSINTHTSARAVKVLMATEKGLEFLDALKISYSPIPGNGSIEHKFWQARIWRKFKDGAHGGIEYSLKPDGKRVDVGIVTPKEKTAFEVVMTGPLEKELSNLRKDLEEGWNLVIFCVETEEIRARLAELISKELSDSDDSVEIVLLGNFYDNKEKR